MSAAGGEWVAIDFETASDRGTPCSVGLARVVRGRVEAPDSFLISPPVFEFSPFNVALHGITPQVCAGAPDWPTSLERILDFAGGARLVAHNASFDIGVIRDACDASGLPWPELEYACTLVVSRRAWPDLPSHSLPFVAAHLGLELSEHHDARADAALAAEIGLRSLDGSETWQSLADRLQIMLGRVSPDAWAGCQSRDTAASVPTEPTAGSSIDAGHPLFRQTVAFTGELAVRRRDAQQAVVDVGGIAAKGVTRATNYLVTGDQDLAKLALGQTKSAKLRKGEGLRAAGLPIRIMTEGEFVALLSGSPVEEAGGTRDGLART